MEGVVIGLLYVLIGCVLSAPYTYLANGGFHHFALTALIAPVVAPFLFFLHKTHNNKQSMWGGSTFRIAVGYFCLPIILNGASILLKLMGLETAGYFVFEGRYLSLLAVPILAIFYGTIKRRA